MPANPVIKKDDVKFEDRTHWLNKSVSFKQARLANQAGMSKSAVNLNVLGPDMESTVSTWRPPLLHSLLLLALEVPFTDLEGGRLLG